MQKLIIVGLMLIIAVSCDISHITNAPTNGFRGYVYNKPPTGKQLELPNKIEKDYLPPVSNDYLPPLNDYLPPDNNNNKGAVEINDDVESADAIDAAVDCESNGCSNIENGDDEGDEYTTEIAYEYVV
jgi:hypothetical protein